MNCEHKMIDLDYVPQAGKDTNVMVISLRLRCRDCGPLRFLGVDAGITLAQPATSTDGCVLHLPVLPEFEEVERHNARLAS